MAIQAISYGDHAAADVRVVVVGSAAARGSVKGALGRDADAVVEAARDLGREPGAVVAVVADAAAARDAFEAGAEGIVLASELERTLPATVSAVASGQVVVPRILQGRLERPAFTAREKQVLSLIVLGCTNRDIARRLHVAETTVKSHVKSSFHKLGVSSRSEACAKILDPREGLGLGILGLSEAARR
jgi:DNA-binding NarL/FixJ family response regulator